MTRPCLLALVLLLVACSGKSPGAIGADTASAQRSKSVV